MAGRQVTKSSDFVVLGASGHVGSVVTRTLLNNGRSVLAVVRDAAKGEALKAAGVEIAVTDVGHPQELRNVLRRGRRAFLLNPPAPFDIDTDAEETRTALSIAEALRGSDLEKVLVESTYGAQAGEAIGDLSVLWTFERAVEATSIPVAINRGAYYFSNLDMLVVQARAGTITTMFPAHLSMPMVAPADLGVAAAERLAGPHDDVGIRYVEGPERYSFNDVAAAFADALGHAVAVQTIDRTDWLKGFKQAGFSDAAALSYARMTKASIEGLEIPHDPLRGETRLQSYISDLVKTTA